MNWSDITSDIGKFAPVLGTLIGGPAGGALGSIVSSALGTANDPGAVQQALINNPDAAVKLRQIEADQAVRLQGLVITSEQNKLNAQTADLSTINATMQTEDKTRSFGWRDYWGFVSGTAFGFVVLIVGYIVEESVRTRHPEMLAQVANIVGSFTTLFGIAAAVLGIHSFIEAHHSGMTDRIEAGEAQKSQQPDTQS